MNEMRFKRRMTDFSVWTGLLCLVFGICMDWTIMFLCGTGIMIYGIMKEFE